jgi:hypothetical protein
MGMAFFFFPSRLAGKHTREFDAFYLIGLSVINFIVRQDCVLERASYFVGTAVYRGALSTKYDCIRNFPFFHSWIVCAFLRFDEKTQVLWSLD